MHYHCTPITPRSTLLMLGGRNFCVSFANPRDVKVVHTIGQSVMLDNGAYTAWTQGVTPNWDDYYRWVEVWLRYHTTWAVIPDVIDGTEQENDKLLDSWPFGQRGAPVWHLGESLDRLGVLIQDWVRVCLGSSGEYAVVGSRKWHDRMTQIFNQYKNPVWFHGLRMMSLAGSVYPLSSVDSANVARNHSSTNRDPRKMMDDIDTRQCPAGWINEPTQPYLRAGRGGSYA